MSDKEILWWEKEISRLRTEIKKLDFALARATYGPAIRKITQRRTVLQFELDNARRAAEAHAQARTSTSLSKELVRTRKPIDRGKFCDQVIDEIKAIRTLHSGSGRSVAEIQDKNPGWGVWKVRESLDSENRETFNHPNRWGPTVGYAKTVLSKTYCVSMDTITSWVKAYRAHRKNQEKKPA
jgi:hypothetical protein